MDLQGFSGSNKNMIIDSLKDIIDEDEINNAN